MKTAIFYSFRRCPFAIRARWAIVLSGIHVLLREVNLKNKPNELLMISPKGTVPVLMTSDNEIIEESIDIMKWALLCNKNDDLIRDNNPSYQKQINTIIMENDTIFKYHLDKYKYSNNQHSHKISKEILGNWSRNLEKSNWLVGEYQSIADIAIWPFVRQLRMVNPTEFDNDVKMFRIKEWLEYYTNHQNFNIVMRKIAFWNSSDTPVTFPNSTES